MKICAEITGEGEAFLVALMKASKLTPEAFLSEMISECLQVMEDILTGKDPSACIKEIEAFKSSSQFIRK